MGNSVKCTPLLGNTPYDVQTFKIGQMVAKMTFHFFQDGKHLKFRTTLDEYLEVFINVQNLHGIADMKMMLQFIIRS